ncbi:restriction endonuclease subunit S [Halothiobacillus sp.]|uniref:restriction endonuclease subunit S n=1 Tax=Halothiobacillus sp. TaxID=1891311 RepID=UPI002AD2A522|nr:restriction endonuclease subunit S [Halothiobacillus sp.]
MTGEWTSLPIEDCMEALIDYRGKTPTKTTFGIPLITAKVVKGGRIETPDEFIAVDDYELWMRRGIPKAGDVVITTEAPLGEVAQLGAERVALAQRLITLRGKDGLLDNGFLKFLMQSENVQDQLRARASGSTVLGIKQSELRKVILTLPPIDEQRSIAHILGTLDDKIELNRHINETLEAIARAIFKSWFVDFDPVRAKASGEAPDSICRRLGLTPDLLALFPDRLVDSELGEIPEGWRPGTLGEVAEHPRRGIQPTQILPNTPYIGLEHMPRRCIALSEWGMADGVESNKFKFNIGEILFGKLRPYFHKVGVAPVDGICSTDIVVIIPKSREWFGFVLGHISSDAFVDHANAGSTGTKMPRTNWADMSHYSIAVPPDYVAEAFASLIRPKIDYINAGIHEARTLASLRDTLLPKLLSGELRVPEAETIMAALA